MMRDGRMKSYMLHGWFRCPRKPNFPSCR
jgi:hypothetical protein